MTRPRQFLIPALATLMAVPALLSEDTPASATVVIVVLLILLWLAAVQAYRSQP